MMQNAAMIPIDNRDYTVEEQPQNQTRMMEIYRRGGSEGDSLENAEDLGEEKLSEQVEELFRKCQKPESEFRWKS